MRILTLSNLYPPDVLGGYEIACAQVVDALHNRGHRVDVLTASPIRPVPHESHVHRRLKLTEDRDWVTPPDAAEDALLLLRDVESRLVCAHNVHVLSVALREFAPEVVYVANLVGVGGLALIACLQFLGVPWVWQLGDTVPVVLCSVRWGLIPALAREFSRSVQGHFVAVSRQLYESIENQGLGLNGPVTIAPNWITGRRPPPRPPRTTGGTLKVISTGRVNLEKGIGILIEAAALLREGGKHDFVIDVYGEVADPSLPPLVRKLGLSDHVVFRGPRPHEQILALYGEYDVLAFPTREREPFGLVALEALAKGCVPVITRRCGVAEWLVHGVHCFKSERDPRAFARVLARIIDGDHRLEPVARRGEEAVWRDFHLDAILPRIERCLLDASRRPRNPAGDGDDAYRLARLAESVAGSFVQEALHA